jgi:predicted nucleic acid-binding protein
MIFVDTSAWFASAVAGDENFAVASQWLKQNKQPLITTDYVVDETLTLLKARGQRVVALNLGQQFFDGALAEIYHLAGEDLRATWETFRRFSDKDWSFTDCTSKVIMENRGITQVFGFDHHFRQFGSVIVVP